MTYLDLRFDVRQVPAGQVNSQQNVSLTPKQGATLRLGLRARFLNFSNVNVMEYYKANTVEFPLVDSPPMWTFLLNGHFLPGPFIFPI